MDSQKESAGAVEIERQTAYTEEIEIVPGTEIMVDTDGKLLVHAQNSPTATVLIPQPTQDPKDPLNWSATWKSVIIFNQGFFVISSVIPALSIAPLTPLLMDTWGRSLSEIALLTGVTVMLLGYCNFIIVPCSDIFGRRVTLIICAAINVGACIWSATATSYSSFLGARILTGTGASANESIMNVVVADMYFLHERGRYIGSYFWCYFVGLFLGPIISGAVADHIGYRWFFWICAISQGLNLISLFFLFPETRRSNLESESDASQARNTQSDEAQNTQRVSAVEPSTGMYERFLGKGKPSRSQFNLGQPIDRVALRNILRHLLTPMYIFFFPIVFWASMSMGAAANALLAVNLLQSQVLAAPPYNFAPEHVGYANFALVVGGIVGLLVAGPWSDWISARATKRNKGIREPEMRLVSLIPFIISALIGLTVFGVGAQDHWPWPVIVVLGFGFVGLQVVAIPTIAITYAIDSYKPVTGEIMVIATVCKNTFGFGMTYFMNDWAASKGFVRPLMLMMAMTVGFTSAGMVLFMISGKVFRRWSKGSKVHTF